MNAVYLEQKDLAESILGEHVVHTNRVLAADALDDARKALSLCKARLTAAGFETTELTEVQDALMQFDQDMFG